MEFFILVLGFCQSRVVPGALAPEPLLALWVCMAAYS